MFNKITFYPVNNIIDFFYLSTIFLQTVDVQILTDLHLDSPLTSFFLLTNNHSSYQQYVKNSVTSIFFILKVIKKFINLKSKTKYTNPKKLAQQKLPIEKLKKIKPN